MSVRVWTFRHHGEGVWKRVPEAWMQRFYQGEVRVTDSTEDSIHIADLAVILDDGVPQAIGRVWFVRIPVDADGRLDQERYMDQLHDVVDLLGDTLLVSRDDPTVVEWSRARFAKRRMQHQAHWQPSAAEGEALRQLLSRPGRSRIQCSPAAWAALCQASAR